MRRHWEHLRIDRRCLADQFCRGKICDMAMPLVYWQHQDDSGDGRVMGTGFSTCPDAEC